MNTKIPYVAIPLLMSACSSGGLFTKVGPDYNIEQPITPTSWYSSQPDYHAQKLAHHGNQAELMHWWEGFQDPVLIRFLKAAENVNATLADAKARIEEARTNVISADGAVMPTIDFSQGVKRSSSSFGGTPFMWNQYSAGLQSSWEVDLFGGLARQQEAARSQLESRNAAWHDARVAVAVEVADAYLAYRYSEAQKQIVLADTNSRIESSRLTAIAAEHGFQSRNEVALATASAAEGQKAVLQQTAQSEHAIKSLVAMTAIEEVELRQLLNPEPNQNAKLPRPVKFTIDSLPAEVLLQRPDIAAAERDVAEASANIGVQRAKQFPKLSLSGTITPTLQNINGGALLLAQTWAIGPTLSLPLFDSGKRAADVEAAKAKYQAASSRFHSKVRIAVKEVEDALVRLNSSNKILPEAQLVIEGYSTNFQAVQTLYQNGLANLLNVEEARRLKLAAELTVTELEREQVSAWLALYRAAGGNWSEDHINSHSANLMTQIIKVNHD